MLEMASGPHRFCFTGSQDMGRCRSPKVVSADVEEEPFGVWGRKRSQYFISFQKGGKIMTESRKGMDKMILMSS